MLTPQYAKMMARYNIWQNASIFGAADGLDDASRKLDRGAFFKSIHGTLSHILWGDMIWMSRFDGGEGPTGEISESMGMIEDWHDLKQARRKTDQRINDWAQKVAPSDFEGDLEWYSGAVKRTMRKPRAVLLAQLFNHQTHHRGQVHAMLTAAGARPDDTDIPFMPENINLLDIS